MGIREVGFGGNCGKKARSSSTNNGDVHNTTFGVYLGQVKNNGGIKGLFWFETCSFLAYIKTKGPRKHDDGNAKQEFIAIGYGNQI